MTFFTTYWVEILLSVISIIVGAIVGYVFYRLQKRDVASAEIERINRAREEMLDILESNVVNKQNISEETIYNLLAASEREYRVSLRDICTPITLLQDVTLRLHRSRHLDINQKTDYSARLEKVILEISESSREISADSTDPIEIARTVEEAIKNNEQEKALENLLLLKRELSTLTAVSKAGDQPEERWQLIASFIAAAGTMVAVFASIADISGIMRDFGVELIAATIGTVAVAVSILLFRRFLDQRRIQSELRRIEKDKDS
jgi:hypothetical protein